MTRILAAAALFAGLCAAGLADEVGPNKMPVAVWGDEEYHLEVIPDTKSQMVTVLVFGGHDDLHKAKRKAIDAKGLTVAFKNPSLTVKLEPAPEKDDPKGKSSKFVGKKEGIGGLGKKIEGTVSGKVGTKPYTGDFKQK
jgi:hypothetical protein